MSVTPPPARGDLNAFCLTVATFLLVLREAKNSTGPLSMIRFLCGSVIVEEAVLAGRLGAEFHGFRGFMPNVVFFGRVGDDCGEDGTGDLSLGRALARMILEAGLRDFFRIGLGVVSSICMSAASSVEPVTIAHLFGWSLAMFRSSVQPLQ